MPGQGLLRQVLGGILEHFLFFIMNTCLQLTYQIAVRKLTSLGLPFKAYLQQWVM